MKRLALIIACLFVNSFFLCGAETGDVNVRIADYNGDRTAAISLTFDDGLLEHYTLVFPELEKRGLKGTFWVYGYCIDNPEWVPNQNGPRVTWAQLKEMSSSGHEISNHSWSHKNLTKLEGEALRTEIERNDTAIFNNTGIFPRTFCYPGNAKSERAIEAASRNRIDTRTFQLSLGSKSTQERFDKWLDDQIKSKGWGVGMTHGITFAYDAFKDPELLWRHLDQLKAMEDTIWTGTFREVAAYIKERDNTLLTIAKKKNGMSVTPVMSPVLDKELFTEPLTLVVDKAGLKKLTAKQGKRELSIKILPDKAMFDFDPSGGTIEVKYK